MQRTPAGLPCGWPGMGELIDGAMQQAAQWGRHSMDSRDFAAPARDHFVTTMSPVCRSRNWST